LGFKARGISPARGLHGGARRAGEERRCGARVGEVVEVHRRGVELKEVTVGQRVGRRGAVLDGPGCGGRRRHGARSRGWLRPEDEG
jgi:hypothetical protein